MNKGKIRHLKHPTTGKMIGTLCSVVSEDFKTIFVASAICHENDSPTRKLGRHIAEQRMLQGIGITMDYEEFKKEMTNGTVVKRFLNDYVLTKRGWQ